jgi:hypothetical protein
MLNSRETGRDAGQYNKWKKAHNNVGKERNGDANKGVDDGPTFVEYANPFNV